MLNYLSRFKKLITKDQDLNQVQSNVEEALNPVISSAIVNGLIVPDVCLRANVATLVTHNLGREALGWIIIRKRADSRIWDVEDFNNKPKSTLALACSHDVQVDLWVF